MDTQDTGTQLGPAIDLLYTEGCPGHEPALALLREVLAELGIEATIRQVHVRTEAEAVEFAFPGSPTIRLDGLDLTAPDVPPPALACRAYQQEDGSLAPVPPRGMLVAALREAALSGD